MMELSQELTLSIFDCLAAQRALRYKLDQHALFPIVERIIFNRLWEERETVISFLSFWGKYVHGAYHIKPDCYDDSSFRHCQESVCLSLVGTLEDIERQRTPPVPVSQ